METTVRNGIIKIILLSKIDSKNADIFEKELFDALDGNEEKEILLDAKNMKYISSAGLRVLLKLYKKARKEISIVNVSDEVYEIFVMTNFTDMFDISKRMRSITLGGKHALLRGVNGMTYQMDDDTMLKVFKKGTRLKDIQKERDYSHTALVCGISTLIPYDVVSVGDDYGIVIESDHAVTLAEAIKKEPDRMNEYAERLADFLKEMHEIQIEKDEFPDIKDRYKEWLEKAGTFISDSDREKITKLTENIPDSSGFVHGDINLNNILIQKNEFYLLDMAGAAHGHEIFDLQGLYASLIMIEKEKPMYCASIFHISSETCKKFWNAFFAKYVEGIDTERMKKLELLLGQSYILKQRLLAVLEEEQ